MSQPGVFLTAAWHNLVMFNYVVDPAHLLPFVPAGTDLDFFEDRTYVSLIGFEFNRTRVMGLSVPFHRSFEEVNLRFYVRRSSHRGVVFIRELVPRLAIAVIARMAFGENYSRTPMSHCVSVQPNSEQVQAEFSWGYGEHHCAMQIETEGAAAVPPDGSLGQFITEHYWGYSRQRDGGSLEYEVQHPRWPVLNARQARLIGNAAHFYGPEFARILLRPPDSAFFAVGSPVTVFRAQRIA
jgi:uncharacterized protein